MVVSVQTAFFLGPAIILKLFLLGPSLSTETFPLYVASGLGTVFWLTVMGGLANLIRG